MNLEITQVDAFADTPFSGNPAAVCLLQTYLPDDVMQHIAAEMNLSETAFLVPFNSSQDSEVAFQSDAGIVDFRLRWFAPAGEVDLCGHATLASAHVLYQAGQVQPDAAIRFHTLSGALLVERLESDALKMQFPVEQGRSDADEALIERIVGMPVRSARANRMDVLAELDDERAVRAVAPNLQLLKQQKFRGLIVTSRSDTDEFDFVSRFFAPRFGIPEDPVTGSAHCFLAPYWADKLGKKRMSARQVSARGGTLLVELTGENVSIEGRAVTVLTGVLRL